MPKSHYRHGRQRAPRKCLACQRTFTSDGPWNRICPRCDSATDRRTAGRTGTEHVNARYHREAKDDA